MRLNTMMTFLIAPPKERDRVEIQEITEEVILDDRYYKISVLMDEIKEIIPEYQLF
jgi:hypothetical protein